MLRLRVKEVAIAKGYNMTSLSRRSDVSFNTIKRLFTKPQEGVNILTLYKIAQALEVSWCDLAEEVPVSS